MAEYIKAGEMAPDFTLVSDQNEEVKLSDYLGKKVVLYFYPKDNTPGCTTEACSFRDEYAAFAEANAVILGVSKDSVAKHQNFKTKYELPFLLLSDPEAEVLGKYGVWQLKKNYGKEYMGIVRTTYIIDEEGKVAKVFKRVKVKEHIQEVLEYLAKM